MGLTLEDLWPAAKVAQLRRAEFQLQKGIMVPAQESGYTVELSMTAVAGWLGFRNTIGYLYTLPVEQEKIFERAEY